MMIIDDRSIIRRMVREASEDEGSLRRQPLLAIIAKEFGYE
jgi:hypothetical protein